MVEMELAEQMLTGISFDAGPQEGEPELSEDEITEQPAEAAA